MFYLKIDKHAWGSYRYNILASEYGLRFTFTTNKLQESIDKYGCCVVVEANNVSTVASTLAELPILVAIVILLMHLSPVINTD